MFHISTWEGIMTPMEEWSWQSRVWLTWIVSRMIVFAWNVWDSCMRRWFQSWLSMSLITFMTFPRPFETSVCWNTFFSPSACLYSTGSSCESQKGGILGLVLMWCHRRVASVHLVCLSRLQNFDKSCIWVAWHHKSKPCLGHSFEYARQGLGGAIAWLHIHNHYYTNTELNTEEFLMLSVDAVPEWIIQEFAVTVCSDTR